MLDNIVAAGLPAQGVPLPGDAKIGIMGGTFNPIHLGHISIATQAYRQFKLDKILFMPLGNPPHKKGPIAPSGHRLAMVELAVRNIPYFEVSRMELDRRGSTYTIDTLMQLHKIYPKENSFFYIVGADTLLEIPTWKNIDTLKDLCEFICFYRPGIDMSRFNSQVEILMQRLNNRIHFAKYEGIDISSTMVRRAVASGFSLDDLVPPGIERFITLTGLYRDGK